MTTATILLNGVNKANDKQELSRVHGLSETAIGNGRITWKEFFTIQHRLSIRGCFSVGKAIV